MKRILSVVLLLCFSFTLLSACTGKIISNNTDFSLKDSSTDVVSHGSVDADSSVVQRPAETEPEADVKTGSRIIKTEYPTEDTVVADFAVTEYGADITGRTSSAEAIEAAIAAAKLAGGGTVWMPAGKYMIDRSINIPSGVTLRGDWQDPDEGNDYGTIILADIPNENTSYSGLFVLNGSSGVIGLTVYYPNQKISSVTPFPFTFFVKGILGSVKNCTVINGYRGVGSSNSSAHEMMTVKNLKGTFLKSAVEIHNSADVGTIDGLTVSSKYWANAGASLENASASDIETYTKANTSGMVITDAEQQQMANITITGCKYGIEFPCTVTRYMGSGSFFNVNISDCIYGIYAAPGTYSGTSGQKNLTTVDYRWGYNIAKSSVEGSEYSIYNGSSSVAGKSGTFKLSGVTLSGQTFGNIIADSINTDLSQYNIVGSAVRKSSSDNFFKLSAGASENDIQTTLDYAGSLGGGTVYLPAGKYTIESGLTVPKNVELRGSNGTAHRIASVGTVFLIAQNVCGDISEAESAAAAVTLNGENAGISGIFFIYGDNISKLDTSKTSDLYPYTVRGNAKAVYADNICIAGASHGIDFRNCENHTVLNFIGCCTVNAINVSGGNGITANCLQNATVLARCGYLNIQESKIFTHIFDPVTRKTTEFIRVGGDGEKIMNCFSYGVKTFIKTTDAKNLLCVNIGADNIGAKGTGVMHILSGGSAVIINSLRYNGDSYINNGCALKIYNRMAISAPNEKDVQN